MTDNKNSLLQSALKYAEKNWYVFPCREKPYRFTDKDGNEQIRVEKTPYTLHGLKEASIDKEQISKWWAEYPDALIAVNAGMSNLICIDVDCKHHKNGLETWMKICGNDEGALHSITVSGGYHIVYKVDSPKKSTTSSIGIDTRAENAYFIVPPSKILEGEFVGSYLALDDWFSKDIALAPSELLNKLNVTKKKNGKRNIIAPVQPYPEKIADVKRALDRLPMTMCDEYVAWISIGMSLYSLGNDGLFLWKNWSMKSTHYQEGICEKKWDTFKPDEITLGSLFFYSKEAKKCPQTLNAS